MPKDKFATELAILLKDFSERDKEEILDRIENEIDKLLQEEK